MTTAVQRRRGTNTEHASFTGLEGELSVNTTNESVHVHDGSTAGGFELARADASNIVATSIDINGGTIDGTTIGASSASTGAFTTLTASGAFTSVGIDDNADATAITIDSSENVGIGNSSPAGYGKFVVQGTGNLINANASSGSAGFQLYEVGQGRFAIETLNGSAGAKFLLAGTEKMRIDSSGNVGIGTSPNASADLHVADTSDARIWLDATSGDTMELYAGTNVSLFNRSNNAVTFGTNNTERMRIDSSGNVGVGTTSPQEMIHAYSASTSAAIRASGNGNNNSKVEIGYHTTNGPYIKAGSSGITGLQFYRDNTVLSAEIHRNTGDFYTNDGTISSLSDSRVKENIQDLADGLEVVKQLKPKTFKYNKKATFYDEKTKDIIRYGFIADEVQEVAPQYTQVGKGKIDGVEVDDLKSLSTTKMIPMLVKAIQEQQTLIESLTARIAALEE